MKVLFLCELICRSQHGAVDSPEVAKLLLSPSSNVRENDLGQSGKIPLTGQRCSTRELNPKPVILVSKPDGGLPSISCEP